MYIGDFRTGDLFDKKFTTVDTSGVPFTLAGSPVISVFKNNSTTPSTSGVTLSADFAGITGYNNVRIDLSSDGTFYSAGGNFAIVITTGTVDGASVVGYVVGEFSIEARSALMPTVAGRKLDVSTGGEAGLDWANIGSPTAAQNLSATNIDVDQVVASVAGAVGSVTGAVGSVTGNVGGNVAGSVGSVTGNVGGNVNGTTNGMTAGGYAANADAFLGRNINGGSSTGRTVKTALAPLRNRVEIDLGGNITVYDTDDTTPLWTGVATRTAGADPITEVDPA